MNFDYTVQKYVRIQEPIDSIIIFSQAIPHTTFKHLKPISAGFCKIEGNKVTCYGESIGLGIASNITDGTKATSQLFGEG